MQIQASSIKFQPQTCVDHEMCIVGIRFQYLEDIVYFIIEWGEGDERNKLKDNSHIHTLRHIIYIKLSYHCCQFQYNSFLNLTD